jgi:CheY-like chemotaxis protein
MTEILIIDDDDRVRRLFRAALELHGYSVRDAEDGIEGVASYRQRPADLVLCDVQMPRQDGLETLQQLRSEFADVRVVLMSATYSGQRQLPAAIARGAAGVFEKPIGMATLVERVREIVGADQ